MRYVILLFALAASAWGGTVSTSATCYQNNPPWFSSVSGTYSVGCTTTWWDISHPLFEHWASDREWAAVSVGLSSVSAEAYSNPDSIYTAGGADADFSAQYVLTLTGGTNLMTFPGHGTGAFFLPCLVVGGASSENFAVMGPFGMHSGNYGASCDGQASGQLPILLDVPMTMQLTLHAQADGCCSLPTGWARFTGEFHFFAYGAGGLTRIDDATYTLTLDDTLPVNLPEPGSFTMMAALLALWPILRHRRRHERHG